MSGYTSLFWCITDQMKPELFIDYLFTRQRWFMHFGFWLFVLFVYAIFFGHQNSNYLQTLFLVALLMPVTAGTTYFMNYFLVPRYLMKERLGLFILYFIYTLIASIFLEMIIVLIIFILVAEWKVSNMTPASTDIIFLMAALLMIVFLGMTIKMVMHWRKSKDDYHKLMLEKVEAELKFLKTQLNPHFLFNTLNNLYYLTSEKSDKAPVAILALSELLDYVLYDARAEFVSLRKELHYLENYISLESMRYEDRLKIKRSVSLMNDTKIVPMVLVTLVENAFKHGVMSHAGEGIISVKIQTTQHEIIIEIGNSFSHDTQKLNGGIGLDNLRSQLSLLYREDYKLELRTEGNYHTTFLKLPVII